MNRFVTLVLIFLSINIYAQLPYSFSSFYSIAQSHIVNPSAPVCEKFTLGIFQTGIFVQNTPFRPMELFLKNTDINNVLENSIAGISQRDYLNLNVNTELLFIGFKLGRFYITGGSYNQISMMFGYPSNLLRLAYFGNLQFQNQTVNLLGNSIETFDYSAVHLGSQIRVKNFSVGARIKLINGIQSFKTEHTNAEVSFYDTAWTLNTNILMRSSGNISEISQNILNFNNHFVPGSTGNRGIGFDIGISLAINDRLSLSAVLADIGYIHWQQNLTEYYSSGTSKFDGLNINLAEENQNISFGEIIDSVSAAFNINERPGTSYTSTLPIRSTLILDYTLFRNHRISGVLDYRRWNYYNIFALGGQYHIPLSKWIYIMGSYTVVRNNFSNIGMGFIVRFLGIQLFAVTDQINALFSAEKLNTISFRTGINISISNPEYYSKKTPNKPQE